MQTHTSIFSVLALVAGTTFARDPPSICMLSPLGTVMAGQQITATIDNPYGKVCTATLVFDNMDFLPVNYELQPVMCLGYQQAEITVPMEAPNGPATILWECASACTKSCSRALIGGGNANSDALVTQQLGAIECVVPISTVTTLSTVVQGSATIVSAVVETAFSTTTPAPTMAPYTETVYTTLTDMTDSATMTATDSAITTATDSAITTATNSAITTATDSAITTATNSAITTATNSAGTSTSTNSTATDSAITTATNSASTSTSTNSTSTDSSITTAINSATASTSPGSTTVGSATAAATSSTSTDSATADLTSTIVATFPTGFLRF